MLRNSAGKVSTPMMSSPNCAFRRVMTRRSLCSTLLREAYRVMASLSRSRQAIAADVLDEVAVGWQRSEHSARQLGGFAEVVVGAVRIVRPAREAFGLGPE